MTNLAVSSSDENSRLSSSTFPDRLLPAQAIHYASRSEMACAILLERYVTGWRCVPGETFQIPLEDKTIDFRIHGVAHFGLRPLWLEYHPILHQHEWDDREALHRLTAILHRVEIKTRVEIWDCMKDELETKYYRRRRALLNSTGHKQEPLVVAHNVLDFHRLLRVLSDSTPDLPEFRQLWNQLVSRQG